jgi:hypothetical protein
MKVGECEKGSIYKNKDGRLRIVWRDKDTGKMHTQSYPRYLLEKINNKSIDINYDVHHIDGDFNNNDINNLKIIEKIEHLKFHNPYKYKDKMMICPICNKEFLWTALAQRNFYGDKGRKVLRHKHELNKPVCSKRCSGLYGKYIQNKYN